MVLAAVDDLLFSSKIRATAKAAGVEVTFARTPDQIVDQARALRPTLIVFDLNSPRTDPLSTLRRLKEDPELAGIRAVGFASHVHTALIQEARLAGADDVMARSAFASGLAEILLTNRTVRP